MIPKTERLQKYKKLHVVFYGLECVGLKVGSIRRIQGIGYDVLEILRVGTMFDIFQNIHILYLEYGVLSFSGYGVLDFIPLWSLALEDCKSVGCLRNKPDIDTMSIDDIYNNFKIVEQEVKRTASSNSSSQNMAFVSSHNTNSTNEVYTAYEVSTASTQSSTASTQVGTAISQTSTANLSDATVYASLANQSNGSQLIHEDLKQIHKDNLEEMDLKWQLALLSMRAKWFFQKTKKKITINGSDTFGFDKSKVECYNCHKMGHFARNKDIPNELKEQTDASLVKDRVSDNKDCPAESLVVVEKKTDVPTLTKVEFVSPKQQEKPVRKPIKYAEMYRKQGIMSDLSDFIEFDGGYVTFGGRENGGRITGKRTLKTCKLDFEDVYFVKELKFNLLSVSQMFYLVTKMGDGVACGDVMDVLGTAIGKCTQVCRHCGALFLNEERLASCSKSSGPQYHKCCSGAFNPHIKNLAKVENGFLLHFCL
nr:hypothetical protein [Tanacetum cinerariifolium]